MIIVADTSPLNYLVLISEVDILPGLFGQVIVPHAVWSELHAPGTPLVVREGQILARHGLRFARLHS